MADELRTIVSLNGEWDLKFDPHNIGKRKHWFTRFPAGTKKMQVPGVWISSGRDRKSAYRRGAP